MLVDTDILIWFDRGYSQAAEFIKKIEQRYISVINYMEWIQGVQSQKELHIIKNFLSEYDFKMLPLTENIGHRASIYVEEFGLSSGLRFSDALIAATALENNLILATGNQKHFKSIQELSLHIFKP